MLPFFCGAQESNRIRFTTLSKTSSEGLKSDLVRDLTQDLSGYVWLTTDRGLSRFDGWETVHYSRDPDSTDGLSSDQLTVIATTRKSKSSLWIGTSSKGLMKFNQETGKATWFMHGTARGGSLLSDNIIDLAISDDQFLWVGTDAGLNVLNLTTEKMVVAEGSLGNTPIASISSIGENEVWVSTMTGDLYKWNRKDQAFTKFWSTTVAITSMVQDSTNKIWIGTEGNGLYSYSSDLSDEPKPHPINGKRITSLFVDSKADLWVGMANGLALLDRNNDSFVYFNNTPRHADSLTDDHVSAIFEDRSNMLWVATYGGGTSRFSLDRQWFSHFRFNPDKEDGLPHSFVNSVTMVAEEGVWIGTDRGLALWNPESGNFQKLERTGADSGASISKVIKDQQGNHWIGTKGNGLIQKLADGSNKIYRHSPADPKSIGHDNISTLFQDSLGRIFVGTKGAGLFQFKPETETFEKIETADKIPAEFINDLVEDSTGNIWIATQSIAFILPKDSPKLVTLESVFPKSTKPTSLRATTILPDSNGIIWIGTADSGLDRFNTNTGEISNFNSAIHGLSDDMIVSLVKDDSNFLWVATRTGIARLNSMQSEFRIFTAEDGLQRDGFNDRAIAKDAQGKLYFGGQDGFNIIDPANLPAIPRTPNPMLTSLEYFGEQVIPRKGGILEKEIAATDEIKIPYDQRVRFALRFANLDYRFPNRGYFRYMLDGYEYQWQLAGSDRKASYSNLSPGKYQFKVQSSLDGREWPDVTAKVRIVISPPWWNTWWAKTLALALFISGIVGVTRMTIQSRVKQIHRREEMLTAQRDKAEAALARQLQNRMLLERTTKDLKNDVTDEQILSDALRPITEQFNATHCLIQRISDEEADDGTVTSTLKQIGYCSKIARAPGEKMPTLSISAPLATRIFKSDSIISLANPNLVPESIRAPFGPTVPISILAAKTSFRDTANGLILLLRVGISAPWTDDDVKLLEALTGQFGLSIAQINTAAIEQKYRSHLEEGRHLAEVANRAKSDFLAKMTHELRTPLNAIIGFSEILGEDKTLNPKQRETLDIINNSGEHLLDVINEILDLSKIEAGKMEKHEEVFELIPLLKSVYEMLSIKANEQRIAFNFAAQSDLPSEILTDRSKLRQILINLIGNAIKFTAQGGVGVTISSSELSKAEMTMGRLHRRIRLTFEIHDTGRGIQEAEIPKLFERYSQTESGRRSSEGTGLGLPIARSFVQMLGGDIQVNSIFGEGTVFRFSIDCEELSQIKTNSTQLKTVLDEKTAQRINGFTSPLKEVRILIAEDQSTNRLLLKRILAKAGFLLAEVEDGQAAITKWSEWKPHLILMDEDMPVKKGSEATREIKALATAEENPVIVSLTAYALEQAKVSALEAGCSDFVAKPFRSHELFAVISKHLGLEYTFNDAA